MPRAAIRLALLSLTPAIVAGLLCLVRDVSVARIGAIGFSIYAAVLLSFLGGVRCGVEIMRASDQPNGMRLAISAAPALLGWAYAAFVTAFPLPPGAAAAFAGLFALQNAWDQRSHNAGAPSWYPMLRQVQTGGMMLVCLLLPFADIVRRF